MSLIDTNDILLIAFLASIFLVGVPICLTIYCLHRRERNRWIRTWERERRHREGSTRYDEEGGWERSNSFVYLAGDSIGIHAVTRV